MQLTISKQDLLAGLTATQGIIEKRNTMPILSNVLMDADDKRLRMVATDLEIGVRLEVPAKVKSAGKITVPARKLLDIVKELPDQDLEFKLVENQQLEFKVGKFRSRIAGLPADEYPNLPSYEDGKFFEVGSEALKRMVARTRYAVSTDETRYNLNGIYFEKAEKGKLLRLVATDGHRLAMTDSSEMGDLGDGWGERGLIVPRKAIAELQKMLDHNEKIELSFQKNHGIARAGNTVLLMQLIDGEFPKYEQVIPAKIEKEVIVSRAGMITAIRRVSPFADERSHLVKMTLSGGVIAIEASSSGVGEAREEVPVEYDGDELTVGFNAKYLGDALAAFESDDVTLGLIDEVNPATIRCTNEENTLAVVMPMRI